MDKTIPDMVSGFGEPRDKKICIVENIPLKRFV
jgi:hypothetical protein